MPVHLKQKGYKTAYFGKTHAVKKEEWDEVFDLHPDYNRYLRGRGINIKYPETPLHNILNHGYSRIPAEDWATNVLGNIGARYIEEQKDAKEPFLLFMSFEAPHAPCTLPQEYKGWYNPKDIDLVEVPENELEGKPKGRVDYLRTRAKFTIDDEDLKWALHIYYSMVTLMDMNVGKLIRAINSSGLREDTVIFFLADHGDWLGNHRCVGKGLSIEQALVHIPLIINCPAKYSAKEIPSLVEAIDVFATIAELAGDNMPRGVQGKSLLPFAEGRECKEREFAFTEEHCATGPYFLGARNKEYKYIFSSDGTEELHNIKKDPWEWYNLVDKSEHRERLLRFKNALLQQRITCVDKTNARTEGPMEHMQGAYERALKSRDSIK